MFTAALAVVLGLSFGAQAATLTITADAATYNISDTITLTIIGDSEGGSAIDILGVLNFNGNLVSGLGGQTQTKLRKPAGGATWTAGGLLVNGVIANTQDSFTQFHGGTLPDLSSKKLTAVMTFHADANGVANFGWNTSVIDGIAFTFFGLTNAPGISVNIGVPVPEPSTAGLMGLGLIGLVVAGRRRKS
jgi:hypothetical protein